MTTDRPVTDEALNSAATVASLYLDDTASPDWHDLTDDELGHRISDADTGLNADDVDWLVEHRNVEAAEISIAHLLEGAS